MAASRRPEVLIESWLPFEAVGAESQRERGASSALPPLYFLHVWWARRPLTVSRAAVLASVLPQWSADWPAHLATKFPTPEAYQAWFQRLLGILGDPVDGRKLIQWAKARGIQLKEHPYAGAPRAFTVNPSQEDLEIMLDLLEHTWGTRELTVLDPMAGGGSIPFEALRYGFTTYANELNPVACVILKATLEYPARFGPSLAEDIRKWGELWCERVRERLAEFFPRQPGESIHAYLWARTVACPATGKPVPLSPNWWLSKGSQPVAVRLRAEPSWSEPRFEIARGEEIDFDPNEGTVRRGVGRSPWTGEAIEGDYIKREAQAGRMGQMLYAVAVKRPGGFDFRPPTAEDLAAVRRAEEALRESLPRWEAEGLVPTERRYLGPADRSANYGILSWDSAFSPRQLLSAVTLLDVLRELAAEMGKDLTDTRAAALATYLSMILDKAAMYNNRCCRFDPSRGIRSIFDRHDFAFVWSHAEFDASANLLPWCVQQVVDSHRELAALARPVQASLFGESGQVGVAGARDGADGGAAATRLRLERESASDLSSLPGGCVHHICVDPPYYDNVMYAELSDFFYVWLKRSVGDLYPELFRDELTNKDEEAVANPARFAGLGRRHDLARQDYERKMAACFREMHRVLRDDGVLTVMFTHKQVEAWDTLATALIGAGFTIRASWPVHTESEHSLHQARKNAAASTILLACRKRAGEPPLSPAWERGQGGEGNPVWWDDIRGRVRQVARERAADFARQGITGVDLYISTFGPVLSIISERWPVLTREVDPKTGEPLPLRPETALDLAREEVIALRKRGLLLGREIQFDPLTDWYLMAWDAFRAVEFPADEARKLALALGLDVEQDLVRGKRVIRKKGSTVVLQPPRLRRRPGLADPEATHFDTLLDAAHAAMLVYEADGAAACPAFLKRAGLRTDETFRQCLQAMLNAIPRTKMRGRFVRPEAEVLENLRLAFFEDLQLPAEDEPVLLEKQIGLWDGGAEQEPEDEIESEDGENQAGD